MEIGAITSYIDVAQLVLYAFWIFFVGLIIYLRREDKREGYPLESDRSQRSPRVKLQGFPAMPGPKTFRMADGRTLVAPDPSKDRRIVQAEPVAAWPGAPLQPTGNPMLDGVGPAAWVERAHHPEMTLDGQAILAPLRLAADYTIPSNDPDPRGMEVVGADGQIGGIVRDVWLDRAEFIIRYLEVEVSAAAGPRQVLVPMPLVRIDGWRKRVKVRSVLGAQFADAPGLAHPDQITLAEEDRVSAYFAGGTLYAEPSRLGPWL